MLFVWITFCNANLIGGFVFQALYAETCVYVSMCFYTELFLAVNVVSHGLHPAIVLLSLYSHPPLNSVSHEFCQLIYENMDSKIQTINCDYRKLRQRAFAFPEPLGCAGARARALKTRIRAMAHFWTRARQHWFTLRSVLPVRALASVQNMLPTDKETKDGFIL